MTKSAHPVSNIPISSKLSEREFEEYYDGRYVSGYMDSWDSFTELKIRRFFQRITIGDRQDWLDFGCGQGALTGLLANICPTASVTGCDISPVAIAKARERIQGAGFSVWNPEKLVEAFDLVFSHHVLEHVQDIDETLDQLDAVTNSNGLHFHILPCGNEGSLEWKVAKSTMNGFEKYGRFFYEEEGHLRRLSSNELTDLYVKRGYRLIEAGFANQKYGAYNWLIGMGPGYITDFADPGRGVSSGAKAWLRWTRLSILLLWRMRYLSENRPTSRVKSSLYPLVHPISKIVVSRFEKALNNEICNEFRNESGSEMLLCFQKPEGTLKS